MGKFRRPHRPERLPCAQMHEDDGIDPREFFRTTGHRRVEHKTDQLCKQVLRTLGCVLAGEFSDPVLQDLSVCAVEPAPDASRLLVTVQIGGLRNRVSAEQVLARLHGVRGVLRCEVAAAIRRKKAPELIYRVANPEEAGT